MNEPRVARVPPAPLPGPNRQSAALALGLLAAGLSGCPSGDDDDSAGECGSFGVASPDLPDLHSVVFARSCAFGSCHDASSPMAGLDLSTPEAAWAALVDVPATTTQNAWVRVAAGDPDASYLLNKLRGEGVENSTTDIYATTTPMPPDEGGLCQPNIDAIAAWIAAGAAP